MAYLLCLETSGTNCSVSITENQELISYKEQNTSEFSHSENLHIFIEETLKNANIKPSDLSASVIKSISWTILLYGYFPEIPISTIFLL